MPHLVNQTQLNHIVGGKMPTDRPIDGVDRGALDWRKPAKPCAGSTDGLRRQTTAHAFGWVSRFEFGVNLSVYLDDYMHGKGWKPNA
jgi:hypothetical protein